MMLNKVSLNTIGLNRIGLNRIGKPSRASSDRPYIDPEVLASLKAVCICYGKSNDDPDRAIVKNLVDPDNPFVISNAAYTEGSGYADKGSPYYGAFVTDGIDDLITSTKTVQEMGITDEVTVVSMIHQIDLNSTYTIATTNYIENSNSREHVRSDVYNYGKTGIYGYSASLINNTKSDIKNILGDEADYYVKSTNSLQTIFDAKFSVVGRISELTEASQVAWYWTIIANKVLTTDQINQVIAYFNLDRTLKPDILCNTIKQGITNENHAEFGDKLIDFSGNGRDIQLNNIAWKGDSGIGKYNFSNINIIANRFEGTVTTNKCHFTKKLINTTSNFCDLIVISPNEPIKFKVSGLSDGRKLFIANKSGSGSNYNFDNGEHEVSLSFSEGVGQNNPFGVTGDIGDIDVTVEFIPSHAGALCLDGVNDFGKVTGMPVYKDYTVVADYERFYLEPITGGRASILSKSSKVGDGSFIFNLEDQNGNKACYTFGEANGNISDDITRIIRYQSKYYNTKTLSIGTAEDNDFMVLGKVREVDNRYFYGAIYSLMSFPYSMSEFLIERQLKKHKLGTLYPDMVEFRPVINSNVPYNRTDYYTGDWKVLNIGDYVPINSKVYINLYTKGADILTNVSSTQFNKITFRKSPNGKNVYDILLNGITKSPQKIDITIDEYIRYEDIDFTNCYPGVPRIYVNDKSVTWGDKLKVGDEFTFYGNVNILPEMYNVLVKALYNGEEMVYGSIGTISKSMVFTSFKTYIFDDNEPKCILSPRLLSIPNSSYKILGYIPDISGHGNNGVIHNSAYTEGSGVNEDGSYQFDGVDDFVAIPTVTGGKQVLMKVNWQSEVGAVTLYDQRLNLPDYEFAIYNGTRDLDDNPVPAYQGRNNGQTYIDGILNSNIMASELKAITHNITITNELSLGTNNTYPVIGSTRSNTHFAQMSLYDFMLFDNISTDDKIKELNEYVGIEGDVWGILTKLSNSTLISNETLIKNE